MQVFEIQAGALEKIARAISGVWLDLITRRQNLTRGDVNFILEKTERFTSQQGQNLASTPMPGSIVPGGWEYWKQQAVQRMGRVAADIRRDLEIRFREQEAFPQAKEERGAATMPSPITVNISNSNISNLNLGNQVGTINTALQALSAQNHQEVAEAIKQLTEGVVADSQLGDVDKQHAVEALSTLAQVAQSDQAKTTVTTKSLLTWLPIALSVSADLVTMWDKFGPMLRSFFGV